MADRDDVRAFAGAVYPLGFLLFLLPLLDVVMRTYPFRYDAPDWRFAAFGMLFGNLGTVLLGLAAIGFVAAYRGNVVLLRVLAGCAIFAGVVVLALLALFVLDALQVRQTAPEALRRPVATSSISATAAGLLAALTLLSLGVGAWVSSRLVRRPPKRAAREPAPNPMVVQSTRGAAGGGGGSVSGGASGGGRGA